MELAVLFRHQMRDVVSIDPGHRGAGLDRQGWRVEGEVGDLYGRIISQCPAAACNQAESENCYRRPRSAAECESRPLGSSARQESLNAIWSCHLLPFLIEMRSAGERRVGDGEQLVAGAHLDACDPEQRAELLGRHRHRSGRWRIPGRGLREGGRSRGMEGHVAFDLLHDLVDVPIEHRDRAEALQEAERLQAIVRAPAPVGVDRPERDMGEDDDRRRVRFVLDIVGEPGELVGPEPSKAAGLEVDHVDEANEMNAVIVEAVPTRALGALAVTVEIGLAQALVDDVMLAGNVVNVELGLTDQLVGIVEFVGLGEMGDIAGMDHEGRARLQRLDLADGLAKRAERIRIGRFIEADMAVADMRKGEG